MAELEHHVEHHDRTEFVSCDACDIDFHDVRAKLDRHVELWASTWASRGASPAAGWISGGINVTDGTGNLPQLVDKFAWCLQ
jgi:hypothetical protein